MKVKKSIKNWNGLVKNRLGPHKIVLKDIETLEYVCTGFRFSNRPQEAFDYSECYLQALTDNIKHIIDGRIIHELLVVKSRQVHPYIITKAGDIELNKKDFKTAWDELE